MNTDYNKILRSMDDLIRPYKYIQSDLERLLKPQLSPLFDSYAGPYLDAIQDRGAHLKQELQRNLYPLKTIESQLRSLFRPHLEAQKRLEEIIPPRHWIQDQFAALLKPPADFLESIRLPLDHQVMRAHEQITSLLDPLNQYLSELQGFAINVDAIGNVSIDGDEISMEEIHAATQTFEATQKSAREFLQSFTTWLGQQTPRVRNVFLFLILPYVVAIVANWTTPIYQEWWNERATTDPRVVKKEIILEAQERYGAARLREYRFVYASQLHIRAGGRMQAEIIDSVTLGKSVRVIRRKKAWTEIEYLNNNTDQLSRGWVYSRYLQKFEK